MGDVCVLNGVSDLFPHLLFDDNRTPGVADPHRNYRRRSLSPETPEQYRARIERNRAEQVEAEKRRAEKAAERKAFEARQREKGM